MSPLSVLIVFIANLVVGRCDDPYSIECSSENRSSCVIKATNPVLNIDICFYDRNITELRATSLKIRELTDVFISCHHLKTLNLSRNELKMLNVNVFHANSALEILVLSSNDIATLPVGIFDALIRLRHLDLSRNRLQHFVAKDLLRRNRALEHLSLTENPLIELDVEFLVQNLREIDITDTHLDCLELEKALKAFRDANITILESPSMDLRKERNFDVTFVNASSCLNDEQRAFQDILRAPLAEKAEKLLKDTRIMQKYQERLINRVLELENNFKFLEEGLLKIMREMREEMNQLKISFENDQRQRKDVNQSKSL